MTDDELREAAAPPAQSHAGGLTPPPSGADKGEPSTEAWRAAAVEAAAKASFAAGGYPYAWEAAFDELRRSYLNDAAIHLAAIEPHVRRAVAEEIAEAIEDVCECSGETDPKIVGQCEYRAAARIARQVGGVR